MAQNISSQNFEGRRDRLMKRVIALQAENSDAFEDLAVEVYRFQYEHNPVYHSFCNLLDRTPASVREIRQIPFLPISSFRDQLIRTGDWEPDFVFESSGTTSSVRSKHAIRERNWYHRCAEICFEAQFGSPDKWCFLALLPTYLERKNASLVHMMDYFIRRSEYDASGFYLDEYGKLMDTIQFLRGKEVPTILIGLSFALYDFATRYEEDLSGLIVMETGGFKGKGPDLMRDELHNVLCEQWNIRAVASEYGMTELLSQFYSSGEGVFNQSPTMRALMHEINDPLSLVRTMDRAGRIHIVDLGNIDSCAFIATEDLGRYTGAHTFTVEGRLDGSMLRGCNLMWRDIKKEPE